MSEVGKSVWFIRYYFKDFISTGVSKTTLCLEKHVTPLVQAVLCKSMTVVMDSQKLGKLTPVLPKSTVSLSLWVLKEKKEMFI